HIPGYYHESPSQMGGRNSSQQGYYYQRHPSRPLTAEEKEIKRKVSHSAIEKRRRERTNAVLRELQNIVPGLCKPGKIQKLEILEAAAEYIRQLSAMPGLPQQRMGGGLPSHLSPQSSSHHYPQYVPHMQQFRQYTGPPVTAHDEPKDMRSESADQHQHQSVATPMSVSSGTIHEDLPDDSLQSALSDPGSSPSDPSSMKVNFLLC
ncbi:Sterol regulatory element-binding protein 2, partial [Linderina macrospora]